MYCMLTYPVEVYQCRWYVKVVQRLWSTKYLMVHCKLKADEMEQLQWMILRGR